jgi:hypothetical protein
MTFETVSEILRGYSNVLTWPLVTLTIAIVYRSTVYRLLSQGTVKLTIAEITLQLTIPEIQASIIESLPGHQITNAQWDWLTRMRDDELGRVELEGQAKREQARLLRPLRNAALIRQLPETSFLEFADAVQITGLGRIFVDTKRRKDRSPSVVYRHIVSILRREPAPDGHDH